MLIIQYALCAINLTDNKKLTINNQFFNHLTFTGYWRSKFWRDTL